MKAFRWSIVYDIEANLIVHVMSDRIKVSYHITFHRFEMGGINK